MKIILRTLHLIGFSGLFAGILFNVSAKEYLVYAVLTILSGSFMILIEVLSNAIWLIQLRGLAVLLKLFLLGGSLFTSKHQSLILFVVIIISGVISHAPGSYRYYSFYHRRRIENLD